MSLITACDPGIDYCRIVQNNSDFDVKVFTAVNHYAQKDTLVIEKNTTKTIFLDSGFGTIRGHENCNIHIDSVPMLINFNDSTKLIPDINKLNNWSFRIIKRNRFGDGGKCECRIILTNALLIEL